MCSGGYSSTNAGAGAGLALYRVKNFAVHGLTVTLTGGDGLYIHECSSCTFVDLNLTDNYRQGCSVISARDTLFENCSFSNTGMTGGTAPRAGVDFVSARATRGRGSPPNHARGPRSRPTDPGRPHPRRGRCWHQSRRGSRGNPCAA